MATTYAAFVNALEALSLTGVRRSYTNGPPASVNVLPASWVQFPSGEEPLMAKGINWPLMRAELVVAYEAVAQGRQPDNFDGTVAMMDVVVAAIRAMTLGRRQPTYDIRVGIVSMGDVDYWAVIATVESEG